MNNGSVSVFRLAFLWAVAWSAVLALATLLVDITDGDIDEPLLFGVAVFSAAATIWAGRAGVRPHRTRGVTILAAVVSAFVGLMVVSAVVYRITGTIDRFDDALFESTAGFTTTHLSVVSDIEAVSRSMLFWRAGTQWIGGLSALALGIIVLPFWIGGREIADPDGRNAGFQALSPTPRRGIRNVVRFYCGFTVVAIAAFIGAGAGIFDGLTYAMTTVATGGFANHPDSLRYFDSAAVELVAAVVMVVAGASVALVWWVLRGSPGPLVRSLELRLYLAAAASATAVFSAAEGVNDASFAASLRHGFVTAAAVVSTTGHWVVDWGRWGPGPQTFLLMLVAIGSMAGSIGGGFRWVNVIGSLNVVRREFRLLLHPTAAVSIKVGKRPTSARSQDQMAAQQSFLFVTVGFGAVIIASLGADLLTAFSVSVSALSTFGPALGEFSSSADATVLAAPARFAVAVLMLAGRLSIYPLPLALGSVLLTARRTLR